MLDGDNVKEENQGKRRIRRLHVCVWMSVEWWLSLQCNMEEAVKTVKNAIRAYETLLK